MNNCSALIVASIFGLVAGMGHGIVSHYQNLPVSLSQQVIESFNGHTNDRTFN